MHSLIHINVSIENTNVFKRKLQTVLKIIENPHIIKLENRLVPLVI